MVDMMPTEHEIRMCKLSQRLSTSDLIEHTIVQLREALEPDLYPCLVGVCIESALGRLTCLQEKLSNRS